MRISTSCHMDRCSLATARLDRSSFRLETDALTGLSNQVDETMDRLAGLVASVLGSSVGLASLFDDLRQFFLGQVGRDDADDVGTDVAQGTTGGGVPQ